jgi:hypothetical protein
MHYLAGTMDYIIHYFWYPAVLEGYTDANWISNMDELYTTSGYVFTLDGATVSWRSCKKIILTWSTMVAELLALDTTTMEVDWVRDLLMDLSIVKKYLSTILMNCNNQTVIVKIDNSKDNMKSSRHIKRRLNSVKKMRNSVIITLNTEKNLTYPFTKGLLHNMIDTTFKDMSLRPT